MQGNAIAFRIYKDAHVAVFRTDLGLRNNNFSAGSLYTVQEDLYIRVAIQVNKRPVGGRGHMEAICLYDAAAHAIHGVVQRKHPHPDILHVDRRHGDLEDGFVKLLRPVDVCRWYLKPTDGMVHINLFGVEKLFSF
mgnify:CR=1 FL=1